MHTQQRLPNRAKHLTHSDPIKRQTARYYMIVEYVDIHGRLCRSVATKSPMNTDPSYCYHLTQIQIRKLQICYGLRIYFKDIIEFLLYNFIHNLSSFD